MSSKSTRPKILCVSSREYGQMGTTGTYKFIEELQKQYIVRVLARPPAANSVYTSQSVPLIPLVTNGGDYENRIDLVKACIRQFAPDIIYIFQSPATPEFLSQLKKLLPHARIVDYS